VQLDVDEMGEDSVLVDNTGELLTAIDLFCG
jgi:hypothetical protein